MKAVPLIRALFCLVLIFSASLSADDGNLEYKVKAGYLYNFTKFVTWPEITGATFNLCILGTDPFGAVIDPIEKKSAFDKPIKVIRLNEAIFLSGPDVKIHCRILYISHSSNPKTAFEKLKIGSHATGMLIVGEGDEFVAGGGMIGFVNRDGKIKLQVNLQSVRQTELKISAKLLEIAELVKEGIHD